MINNIITLAAACGVMVSVMLISSQLYHECTSDRETAESMRECMQTGARYDDCRYWVLESKK